MIGFLEYNKKNIMLQEFKSSLVHGEVSHGIGFTSCFYGRGFSFGLLFGLGVLGLSSVAL